MPEIKIKHVVSFSSEDRVHKAENLLKPETYRKWKCATPGEKIANVVLQFEKASQIHSIDIGNEGSAFVEVLVGRSSLSLSDYQVLLVASSFMSPLESRKEEHCNRVRMFGHDKLAQNLKDEKWDCVQIVCSQPFNKNITYGLSFIKFHSPPGKNETQPADSVEKSPTVQVGAFKVRDEDEESLPSVGAWFGKRKLSSENLSTKSSDTEKQAPSYAAAVLASSSDSPTFSPQSNVVKRKLMECENNSQEPQSEKEPIRKRKLEVSENVSQEPLARKDPLVPHVTKEGNSKRYIFGLKESGQRKTRYGHKMLNSSINKTGEANKRKPFSCIMEKVVFVISGFVNPLRSELRDKAIEMGARYKGDWDKTCTHLICAFVNTPKYLQVRKERGKIVTKDWLLDCHKKKTLLPWKNYMLGKYGADSSDETESDLEPPVTTTRKAQAESSGLGLNGVGESKDKKNNQNSKEKVVNNENSSYQSKSKSDQKVTVKEGSETEDEGTIKEESETEDEEAIADYMADTDFNSDSGDDTEDEIRKLESKTQKKNLKKATPTKRAKYLSDEETDSSDVQKETCLMSKPDTESLPLPELPNLFKNKHFYLFGDFPSKTRHDMQRFITAYNGVLENYMTEAVRYVITEMKWSQKFEEALGENEDLIFVKPQWIYKCHELGRLIPYHSYIIIPES